MSLFSVSRSEQYEQIECPPNLDATAAEAFIDATKDWTTGSIYVLNFKDTTEIHRDFYRAIIQFQAALKKANKHLFSIGLSQTLIKQLKADGVESALHPVKSITEALKAVAGRSLETINVDIVNPFITATQKTLEIQCQTKATPGKPALKSGELEGAAIAGLLSLVSEEFTGSICLCFTEPVFLKIYENMMGEKAQKLTPEIQDAAGELLNIIYGVAKADLNAKGHTFQKAIPTVLSGDKLHIRHTGRKPVIVLPFTTDAGPFRVEIQLE